MTDGRILYTSDLVALLEAVWGEGCLSPGGPEEVAHLLRDVDLSGRKVLDIGCGIGGVTVSLVREHGAAHVTGIDVEDALCEAARARVAAAELGERVTIRQVAPGPLPFPDESFDVVFSKDSIVHIPDKEGLAAEVFRVLRPGGLFVASDWLTARDGEMSPEMRDFLELEDLDYAMASPDRYARALEAAGFTGIALENRNPWYREVAPGEVALLSGPRRGEFEARFGAELVAETIASWTAMLTVLDSGEHCPHHMRARRPA